VKQRRRLARNLFETRGLELEPRERAEQPPRIRHFRFREESVDVCLLDDAAAVHDEHVVGELRDDPEIVSDHHDRHLVLLLQAAHQPQDLCLRRHVQRRRRLVGDDDLRVVDQRHRDHHALTHAARELVRIVVDPGVGARDLDLFEHLDRALARLLLREVVVQQHGLLKLPPDLLDRIERRHRILEDHPDALAADLLQARGPGTENLVPVEADGAAHLGVLLQEPHYGEERDALARPRLADDAERFSLLE
jgi:hypothetical protein